MGRTAKIDQYGLKDLCLRLYFEDGLSMEAVAGRLTAELAGRGKNEKILQPAVSRYLSDIRAERQAQVVRQIQDFTQATIPDDLRLLQEIQEFHYNIFKNKDAHSKDRRQAGYDLVRNIEAKVRLAVSVSGADKNPDQVLAFIKNEFGGILSRNITNNVSGIGITDFTRYQKSPVAFGELELGEMYTPDICRMMESVRDNQVTIARSANATGKTHGAARVAVWWRMAYPDSQVYTSAAPPEGNLKKLLWGEINSIASKYPHLFKDQKVQSLHIESAPQSFLTGVTIPVSGTSTEREAKFSGKHSPNLLFILDEGDAIPNEVFKGIESCMSGGNARLLVMFNPRGTRGRVWEMERNGEANVVKLSAFSHPNVVRGEDIIPGAVTRDKTVERVHKWCRPLQPDEEMDTTCFCLPKFLENHVAPKTDGSFYPSLKPGNYKIIEPAFYYMVLGEYPAEGSNQLVAMDWVNNARSRWDAYVAVHGESPPEHTRPVMGLDVAEYGTDANAAVLRFGGFVPRIRTSSGNDPDTTAVDAAEIYHKNNVMYANIDGTGVGAGVAPRMVKSGCNAWSVKASSSSTRDCEFGNFYRMRDQLWWALREWLRSGDAMLPPDELLVQEILSPEYMIVKDEIRITDKDTLRAMLKRSPDRADGLCLTFYEPDNVYNL